MENVILYNQVKVPILGLGTFMISSEDTERSVYMALKGGYRLIDTANAYLNEEAVGKAISRAIKEGIVRREEIFVSTKIWATLYEKEEAVSDTLARLGLEYVDLLFIHQPSGNFVAGYRKLEQSYRDGVARSLGISNMHGDKLERLLAAAKVKPHVIQLEAHPYCTEREVMERMAEYGTRLMGWYPLGHGDAELIKEPIFARLSEKYRKSPAQIILRWHTQMGFITIPGSKNPDHIRDNLNIFDFRLTVEEMSEIAELDGKKKYYEPDNATEEKYATMHLPFEESR
ncbi:MAG: aldo/keto reductase [Selenomonas sp.]|nr:aldo/keto reductase [Selenomonas sp.]